MHSIDCYISIPTSKEQQDILSNILFRRVNTVCQSVLSHTRRKEPFYGSFTRHGELGPAAGVHCIAYHTRRHTVNH
jgi:hypothetical protein